MRRKEYFIVEILKSMVLIKNELSTNMNLNEFQGVVGFSSSAETWSVAPGRV